MEKARASLIAQGKNPSVDAVRVALGNTGSKTMIHRLLKVLDHEQGDGRKVAISDALQDLVGRLAARLHEEAQARIADAQQRFDTRHRDDQAALDQLRKESAGLAEQLGHSRATLRDEQAAHATARTELQASQVSRSQLEEHVAGLTARIAEHEQHALSLEQKHQQACEALEHFRTSAKEQRDQENRRHEHQVQGLHVELHRAQEALGTKNHELLQVSRDAARLNEQLGQAQKELQQSQTNAHQRQEALDLLVAVRDELQALKARSVQDAQTLERSARELEQNRGDLARERGAFGGRARGGRRASPC